MKKSHPLPITWKTESLSLILIILAALTSIYFYIHFPLEVTSHWNIDGQPNGFMPRALGAFLLPIVMCITYLIFFFLPLIDPRKEQYNSFATSYNVIKTAVLACLFVIYIVTSLYNIGYMIDVITVIPITIGLLMIAIGIAIRSIKLNWFIGIRTPWSLSSESVWRKTHNVGGYMFVIFGIILILMPFLPGTYAITIFLLGIILVTIIPVIYSYILFREEKNN